MKMNYLPDVGDTLNKFTVIYKMAAVQIVKLKGIYAPFHMNVS